VAKEPFLRDSRCLGRHGLCVAPGHVSWLSWIALALIAASAVILIGFLIKRPPLTPSAKVALLAGLGVLPIGAALAGNIANYEMTKKREFCGSCHVMWDYAHDAADPESGTLAAAHSRLPMFGDESCYNCHSDYGMFGTVTTKIGGMRHVWDYYSQDWDAPGHRTPRLYKPFSNSACQQCHALQRKPEKLEHRVHMEAIKSDGVRCADMGCHRPPHPACVTWHEFESKPFDIEKSEASTPAPSTAPPSPSASAAVAP